MNVGDYVRFKDKRGNTYIRQIKDLPQDIRYGAIKIDIEANYSDMLSPKNVIKSSPNIIDLIEAGDYVNGDRVVEHAYEPGRLFVENIYVGGKGQTTIEDYSYELTSKYCYDEPDFIKSIVTKQQFERMEYKAGE